MSSDERSSNLEALSREAAYYRGRTNSLAAALLQTDARLSSQRHELEQKRSGFALLARLTESLNSVDANEQEIFRRASAEINAALGMQRTLVLAPDQSGAFRVAVMHGYEQAQAAAIAGRAPDRPAAVLLAQAPVIRNKAVRDPALDPVSEWLELPYFVAAPVVVEGQTQAVLLTGRTMERHPFMPGLDDGDAATVQAIAAFLATLLYQQRLDEARDLANHDPLTGLPNLRLVTDRLQRALARANREGERVGVLYLDLDGFKSLNDTLGHAAGDLALKTSARRLEDCVRESDTVARIGGDEFLVIVPALGHASGAGTVAEQIIAALSPPMHWRDEEVRVGVSIGISIYPDDSANRSRNPESLIRLADWAMYRSKRRGRNCYSFARGASRVDGE